MAQRGGEVSVFLFLHTYDIHLPYDPPSSLATMFTPGNYSGPVAGPNTTEIARKVRRLLEFKDFEETVELSADDRAAFMGLYDGEIRFTDDYLGQLFDVLEELDLLERALIVIFSDHGEEFWDHGSVSHAHTLYQELIRVPLLIRFPGGAYGGNQFEHPVMLVDIMPTVLEALRVTVPPRLDGISLLAPITGEARPADRPLLSEMNQTKALIRYPWKLVMDLENGDRRLFNLRDDPGEKRSLANKEAGIVTALQKELLSLLVDSSATETEGSLEDIKEGPLRDQLRALGYLNPRE